MLHQGIETRRRGPLLSLGLCLVVALLLWGCATAEPGTSTPPPTDVGPSVSVEGPASTSGSGQSPAPPEAAAPISEPPVDIEVGNDVGQRVPDFAIDLVDGTTVTAVDLLAEGQPTFLFFFATW